MNPLPSSTDAERAVLGSCILNPLAFTRVIGIVTSADFHHDRHKLVFAAMEELSRCGKPLEFTALTEELRRCNKIEAVGGVSQVSALIDRLPDIANVEHYARQVREHSEQRKLMRVASKVLQMPGEGLSAAEIATWLQSETSGVGSLQGRESRSIHDVMQQVRLEADERAAKGELIGVRTGFQQLDELTLGLPRQALTVLGAKSSHGKTTLALNLALSAIESDPNTRVVVYSLEMSKEAVSNTLRARISGVPLTNIRRWSGLSQEERNRVLAADSYFASVRENLYFADRLSNIHEILADARRRHLTSGLDLLVVDYLQLVEGLEEERRERSVSQIAWRLAELGKDLNCAVLALSQVNDASERRSSGRLSIDDLRDAKAIGYHARLAMLLNRPWQADKTRNDLLPCHSILQIEKQSQGAVSDVLLHFAGPTQEFREGVCTSRCKYAEQFYGCGECEKSWRTA